MQQAVDSKLRNNQAGFRAGMSWCTDQIATLRIILEQCQELNTSLYVNFIDYSKAFDSVDRSCLWKIMAHYGIPDKLISLIKKMYSESGGQILLKGRLSTFFEIVSGVRQGCLLSPFLFLLVIDYVMRQSTGNIYGRKWTNSFVGNYWKRIKTLCKEWLKKGKKASNETYFITSGICNKCKINVGKEHFSAGKEQQYA